MRSQPFEVFRVLGVLSRLRILDLLKNEGPSPVKTIAGKLGITPAAVSQHMKALRYAGLVSSERRGYWVPYAVDAEALERCCGELMQVCTCPSGPGATDRAELLKRKRVLEAELQRVERRLEAMRRGKP